MKRTESLGSYTRSAARATFSAYRSIPIRWRLAGGSAVLTLVILAAFAGIAGSLIDRQVRLQFDAEAHASFQQLASDLNGKLAFSKKGNLDCTRPTIGLGPFAQAGQAQIRIYDPSDQLLLCTQTRERPKLKSAPPLEATAFGSPPTRTSGTFDQSGYRVEIHPISLKSNGQVLLLYAVKLSRVDHTTAEVQIFLLLGVLGGTVAALLAGLFVSQRAMRPIVELTDAAREIERTRDPSLRLPHPEADDEIAELARTLDGMLGGLDQARSEIQAMLERQREFVADASHELRTPLTSVLANLELLTEELEGEEAETAEAALRSTRRMRRLVGDLLLLARADAHRVQPHRPLDLADVLVEAASELEPVADHHEVAIDPSPAPVSGARDELHRLMLNLLENAIRHTPPGTHVEAATSAQDGQAVLVVQDDGPGIPGELGARVFERFVRGGRDGARGSGLGLSIVRAVAQSHGGSVTLEPREEGRAGARFVIRLPLAVAPAETAPSGNGEAKADQASAEEDPAGAGQTSTTTGSTIGRRRNRS